jgi:hypothetical protein
MEKYSMLAGINLNVHKYPQRMYISTYNGECRKKMFPFEK